MGMRTARTLRAAVAVGAGMTLLATGALALADGGQGHGGKHGHGRDGFHFTLNVNLNFNDLGGVPFARQAIHNLTGECVFEGMGQHQFDPQAATTRAEMAVLLARLMGWSGPAPVPGGPMGPTAPGGPAGPGGLGGGSALPPGLAAQGPGAGPLAPGTGPAPAPGPAPVPVNRWASRDRGFGGFRGLALGHFRDAGQIPRWAESDVQFALDAGILQGEQDDQFAPGGTVTWAQAAVIVQRVFNVPPVAPAQVSADLQQLQNGGATPPWAQQAVAADVAAGLFSGTLAQSYNPDQAINRADMAVLLQNAETATATAVAPSSQLLVGRVVSASASALVVESGCGVFSVPLGSSVTVYQHGAPGGSVSALSPGEVVLVGLNSGQGTFVDILSTPAAPAPQPVTSGTVVSVNSTQIEIQQGTATSTFTLAPDVVVGGDTSTVSGVQAGDQVTLTLNASGQVAEIVDGGHSQAQIVVGTVSQVSNGTVTVSVTTSQGAEQESYPIASDATVTLNGSTQGSLSNVQSGDQVILALENGQVGAIDITATTQTSQVSGTVDWVSSSQIELTEADNTAYTYDLAAGATVTGQASSLTAVTMGDSVTLTLDASGQASQIDVTALPQTSTVTGTVDSVSATQIQVTPSNNVAYTYDIASGATVSGQASALSALAAGDTVTLTLNAAGEVTDIDVTAVPQTSTVTGTVDAISSTQIQITPSSGAALTYTFASGVAVSGQASALSALAVGDTVTLTLNATGEVTDIDVTTVPQPSSVTGTVDAISSTQIQITPSSGAALTYTIASGATVSVKGTSSSLSAVQVGDQVTLTLNQAAQISTIDVTAAPAVTSTVGGIVLAAAQQPASVTVAAYDASNGTYSTQTLDLATAASVTLGGASSTLGNLQAGDAVTVGIDAAGQAASVAATAIASNTTTASGVVDLNSNGQFGVHTLPSGQQVTFNDGPAPLTVQQANGAWSSVALSSVAIGTQVTAISGVAAGSSLLVIVG